MGWVGVLRLQEADEMWTAVVPSMQTAALPELVHAPNVGELLDKALTVVRDSRRGVPGGADVTIEWIDVPADTNGLLELRRRLREAVERTRAAADAPMPPLPKGGDPGGSFPIVWGSNIRRACLSGYAAWWYSLMSPPRTGWRYTAATSVSSGIGGGWGGWSCCPRCGRWVL
jgi:hypothetical protein